jgi:dCMP deaminase
MLHAHLAATRNTCDRGPALFFDPDRHGVGAVIVRDKRLIAGGYNGSPPMEPHCDEVGHHMVEGHCVRTIHSEMNALIQCALDGVSPADSTIYTTASPCFDCSKLIIRAKIKRVVVGQDYESRYGLSSGTKVKLEDAGVTVDHLLLSQEDFLRRSPTF